MSKKFKQIMNKNEKFHNSSKRKDTRFKKYYKEGGNEITCFECKNPRHMKAEYPQFKKKRYFGNKKKKSMMVTQDDSDSEKSSSSNDEQANICLIVDTNEKTEVNSCFEFDTSSYASSDNEEDMPYDVLLQNYHMISLQRKKFKENIYHMFVKH